MGRPVHELETELTVTDLYEYRAFWRIKAEAEEKAVKRAQQEARTSRGRRGRR